MLIRGSCAVNGACWGRGGWRTSRRLSVPLLSRFQGLLLAVWVVIPSPGALAQAWSWSPDLALSEIYSDNVALSSSGGAEQDWVSELRPSLTLSRRGRRASLGLFYQLQGLYFARDQRRNEVYQQLEGGLHLNARGLGGYLDARGRLDQQTVDSSLPVALDNLNASGNRTDRMVWNISPGVRQRLWSDLVADIGLGHTQTEYGRGRLDSYEERLSLTLSHRRPRRFDWGVDGLRLQTRFGNGVSTENGSVSFSMRYRWLRSWRVEGRAGYEDIRSSLPGDFDAATENWSLALLWDPTRRSHFELRSGERFFGKTYGLVWKTQRRRSRWDMAYFEDVQTISSQPNVTSPLASTIDNIATFTTELFVSRRLTFAWHRLSHRFKVDLSGYSERRSFSRQGRSERLLAADMGMRWHWLPRTFVHAGLGMTQRVVSTGAGRDTIRYAEIWLEYRPGPRGRLMTKYRNQHRDSAGRIRGYDANSLMASFEWTWGRSSQQVGR